MIAARLQTALALGVLIGSVSIGAEAWAESGERRALIIAVSDYGADRFRLGAGRDAKVLEAALLHRGSTPENVLVLQGEGSIYSVRREGCGLGVLLARALILGAAQVVSEAVQVRFVLFGVLLGQDADGDP